MTSIKFRSPIKVGVNEAIALSRAAENTGKTIYIRKNDKNKFLAINSIIGFLSLRIHKNNSITILCEVDGDEGYTILNEIKASFDALR